MRARVSEGRGERLVLARYEGDTHSYIGCCDFDGLID